VRLGDCANEPFVLFPRASAPMLYDQIDTACRQAGFSPSIDTEAREWHTIVALVAAGFGLAIAPATVGRLRIRGVVLRPITPAIGRAVLYLCYLKKSSPDIVCALAEYLRRARRRGGHIGHMR
jgi:DNA-binding transcriptional LysR family regulator